MRKIQEMQLSNVSQSNTRKQSVMLNQDTHDVRSSAGIASPMS